jgi:serine/threonine protein kinase/WD40 repeat protein
MSTLNVVESIFIAALEKETPEARAAYLAEACAADADLRRCVERLLNAHARADSILPAQAPGLPVTSESPPIEERPGSIIGPYKLLQQLGEGGFGVVFMAEQEQPVRRKVALKIIKPGMDSKQVVARFEAERQALALMDHPNIARVLDGGTTESGRPYFVMELVKGIPITEFCDQNRLTPRERLELFIPVCQAVQHAHQKGVIHRDLKPSNILVTLYDDKPVPKVIDFGVAKAIEQKLTEQTLFTRVGQIIGTLEYMSPEQASPGALDVDTRSDVYALGVLLYELLTGTTPLDKERLQGAAFLEMLRLIRETEPPRPSARLSGLGGGLSMMAAYRKTDAHKLAKLVAGELDWIAMKALDKDRTRRYETASALAADVRRYLSEEPVEARPPSAWYRFRKLARRNRVVVTAGVLVAASLVLGTVVASLFALEAGRNAAWALDEKDKAGRQTELAQAREKQAEEATELAQARETEAKEANAQLWIAQEEQLRFLYPANMKLVPGAWQADNAGRVLELLKGVTPAHGQKDLRGFEWHYWNRVIHGAKEVVELKGGQPKPHAEFSPNRSLLASLAMGGDQVFVRLWDTKTGAVVRDLKGPVLVPPLPGRMRTPDLAIGHITFSADGQWLAAIIRMATVSAKGQTDDIMEIFGGPGPKLETPELWLWEVKSGSHLWHKLLPGAAPVLDRSFFCFDPAGKSIAVHFKAHEAGAAIHQLDLKSGDLVGEFAAPKDATKDGFVTTLLCLSPDWKKLLLNQYRKDIMSKKKQPGTLLLWDVENNAELWRVSNPLDSGKYSLLKSTGAAVQIAEFSPDGKQLFVHERWGKSNKKTEICVCDAANGKILCQCKEDSAPSATDAMGLLTTGQFHFSPDGKYLIGKPRGPEAPGTPIRIWDTKTGTLRHKVMIPADRVWDVAYSPAGDSLTIALGKTVQIWPAGRPKPFRVSADGKTVQVWPADRPKPISTSADPAYLLFYPSLSADSRRLAVVTWPPTGADEEKHKHSAILVLDTATGEELLTVKSLRAPVHKLVLSADGKRLVARVGALTPDTAEKLKTEMVVWDVEEQREVSSCPLPASAGVVAFASDGRLVALSYSQGDNKFALRLWKLPEGKDLSNHKEIVIGTYTGSGLGGAHFSPDGRLLFFATREPKGASMFSGKWLPHLFDVQSGQALSAPPALHLETGGGPGMLDTPTSMSGNLLAWYDGPIHNFNANKSCDIVVADLHAKGKKNLRLMGHSVPVVSMAFNPDGQRLASLAAPGKGQGEIKIWDLHTGQDVLTLTTEARGSLQFSADGHRLFLVTRRSNNPNQGMSSCEVHTWDATPLPGSVP